MQKWYTDRLCLAVIDGNYAKGVLDYYERNKNLLSNWEPERDDEFYTIEHHEEQLNDSYERVQNRQELRLWIFKKNDENLERPIGTLGFSNIVYGCFLSCFLGYKLDENELNKGYMTEALKKGIEIAFEDYGLHRIEANIIPRNEPSLAVVRKLGFIEEGLSPKYLKINGKWEDHIHMVLRNKALES
ncbi:MAG: GNAT family N-acetyltransferase [Tissierellales bacterium]|jgi:ribosomal-protein-alanine N-acetyltransferase|nr:GNAT family N-acetyltransferase [Tissierellales bacterium]